MKTIVVTGDPICDHNYYTGHRRTADSREERGFRFYRVAGGALLLKELIARVVSDREGKNAGWSTEFGLDAEFELLPHAHHAYCIWEPQTGADKIEYWRAIEPALGYGHPGQQAAAGICPKPREDAYAPRSAPLAQGPDVLVIDDAGIGFRDASRKALWGFAEGKDRGGPEWLVLKMTGSFGHNALWDELVRQKRKNLVVIIPAEQLRGRDVRLSRGLSWEATAEDLMAELRENPDLSPLRSARHLMVTFQSDGVFWLDNRPDDAKAWLIFDGSRAEGEWSASQGEGGAFGYLSCLTASVVREICYPSDCTIPDKPVPDFEAALVAGLGASRELRVVGHGPVRADGREPEPGFPFDRMVKRIVDRTTGKGAAARSGFVSALIPQEQRQRGGWMMLDEWQVQVGPGAQRRPHYEAALAVAILGQEALERFPVAEFGKYLTVDRREIESLRTIRQLISTYLAEKRPSAPLNLGVFGPPGSGKSYIVKQIARAVNIAKEDVLLFNLSQFKDAGDIVGAFHQIRDKVLEGTTPFVFWDEFDAQGYRWLQYLLAPMEDGEFQDGQVTHPLGKCIFAFAGATSSTFDNFGPINPLRMTEEERNRLQELEPARLQAIEDDWRQFVLAKGPDFRSRLVAYLNLLGMNRRQSCTERNGRRTWADDPTDLCFPIRRALFIRANFDLKRSERLNLDPSVLRALLEIPVYKGAGRSLQFLCQHLRKQSIGRPGRSGFPAHELLNMHVEAEVFWMLCERERKLLPLAEKLARGFHDDWRKNPASRGNVWNKPWEELDEATRASNVEQALRMASNLAVAGLRIEPGNAFPPALERKVRARINERIEIMAEAEHNGWMVERMIAGWRYARIPKKDTVNLLHPLLLPYAQLPEAEKEKDRRPIRGFVPNDAQKKAGEPPVAGYVDRLKAAGHRIVFSDVTSGPVRKARA